MKHIPHTRSSLFLIELIIAVFFFSIGSAVCIRAFSQAYLMSRSAQELSFASSQISGAASAVRYTDRSAEALSEYFPSARADDSGCLIYYDRNRRPCSPEEASYTMTIRTEQDGIRTDIFLSMTRQDGAVLYELSLRYPSAVTAGKEE